ncbi:RNA exonuclease 4 [Mycena chlorophos]|uniref:RNA exonuclease 4 n=1 Tax=Mycena chlorophos TaxID=658473 RepID=A0A8H6T2Q7_MYCCL|nr:RNA exonuclease 4 [Mycena chlorophos]
MSVAQSTSDWLPSLLENPDAVGSLCCTLADQRAKLTLEKRKTRTNPTLVRLSAALLPSDLGEESVPGVGLCFPWYGLRITSSQELLDEERDRVGEMVLDTHHDIETIGRISAEYGDPAPHPDDQLFDPNALADPAEGLETLLRHLIAWSSDKAGRFIDCDSVNVPIPSPFAEVFLPCSMLFENEYWATFRTGIPGCGSTGLVTEFFGDLLRTTAASKTALTNGRFVAMDLTDIVVDWTRNEICDWDNLVHLAFQRYWARVDASPCGPGSSAEPPMDVVAASRLVCNTPVGDLAALPIHCWNSIPHLLRRKIDCEVAPDAIAEDVDSWIYSSERYLEANAGLEEGGVGRGLVSLEELAHAFPLVSETEKMRVVPRLRDLPGNYPFGQASSTSTCLVQRSSDTFANAFDILTGGILRGLQWGNICAAGGAVLEAESDVDLFLYDVTPDTAESKIRLIYSTIRNNLPEDEETLIVVLTHRMLDPQHPALLRSGYLRPGLGRSDLVDAARAARALETGFNTPAHRDVAGLFPERGHDVVDGENPQVRATRGYPLRILPACVRSLPPRIRLDRITLRQRTIVDERQKAYDVQYKTHTTPIDYRPRNVSNGLRSFATLAQFARVWSIRSERHTRFPWGPAVGLSAIEQIVATLNFTKTKSAVDAVAQICIAGFGVALDPGMQMYQEVLGKSAAVSWGLVIPDSLAAFANEIITEVQVARGLPIETTVLPVRGQSGERVLLTSRGLQPLPILQPKDLPAGSAVSFEEVRREVALLLRGRIVVGHSLWEQLSVPSFAQAVYPVLGFKHPAVETRDVALYLPFRKALKSPNMILGIRTLCYRLMGRSLHDCYIDPVESAHASMDLYRSHLRQWETQIASGVWPSDLPPAAYSRYYK